MSNNAPAAPASPSRPKVQRASPRAWGTGIGLFLLGVAVVVLGGGTFDLVSLSAYWQGVAANVGVAILLIGPLVVVERTISAQITDVGERVEEARVDSREARQEVKRVADATEATLSNLTSEVRAGLEAIRSRDVGLHHRVLDEVTQESLVALSHRAMELSALDRLGIRVALPETSIWVRARAIKRQAEGESEPVWLIELEAQRKKGEAIGTASVIWSPGEPRARAVR